MKSTRYISAYALTHIVHFATEETDHQFHAELLGILATGNTTTAIKNFLKKKLDSQASRRIIW